MSSGGPSGTSDTEKFEIMPGVAADKIKKQKIGDALI
jgi:hypothetical protein